MLLAGSITSEWPWWKELHSFWRELPNYNPICVTTSTPGVDHAGQAAAAFNPDAILESHEESVPTATNEAGAGGEVANEEQDELEEGNGDAEIDELISDWDVCCFIYLCVLYLMSCIAHPLATSCYRYSSKVQICPPQSETDHCQTCHCPQWSGCWFSKGAVYERQ